MKKVLVPFTVDNEIKSHNFAQQNVMWIVVHHFFHHFLCKNVIAYHNLSKYLHKNGGKLCKIIPNCIYIHHMSTICKRISKYLQTNFKIC